MSAKMIAALPAGTGTATLHSRVERWECDYNNHWNVRFYCRSFQLADEVASAASGGSIDDRNQARHLRFHAELQDAAPVEVRSMEVADGPHAGTTVHVLQSEGHVSASAMDFGGASRPGLPRVSSDLLSFALPRGLPAGRPRLGPPTAPQGQCVQLGPARPLEFDHCGRFLDEEILRRISVISHDYLTAHGFGREFTRTTGTNRMSIEMKLMRHRNCNPGATLRGDTRLTATNPKNFILRHDIFDTQGCLASIEQCLVVVDLGSRRLVPVPYDRLNLVPA